MVIRLVFVEPRFSNFNSNRNGSNSLSKESNQLVLAESQKNEEAFLRFLSLIFLQGKQLTEEFG